MTIKLEDYVGLTIDKVARSSNTSTIITDSAHGLFTGETVTISGCTDATFDSTDATVTVTNSTTFTYANSGSDTGSKDEDTGLVFPNFTFQHNPNVFDGTIDPFIDVMKFKGYVFTHVGMSRPLMSTQTLTLSGFFNGTNKDVYYRNLLKHFNTNKLQKLLYESDTFYLVVPQNCKKTNSGMRTYFIDYVCSFLSPFGVLFGTTQKSGTKASTNDNDGNMPTPIEMISGSVTSGHVYIVKDTSGNGFSFTASATGTVYIKLINMRYLGQDAWITNYVDVDIAGTKQVVDFATTGYSQLIFIQPNSTLASVMTGGSSAVTDNGGAWSATFYWRDAWSSE